MPRVKSRAGHLPANTTCCCPATVAALTHSFKKGELLHSQTTMRFPPFYCVLLLRLLENSSAFPTAFTQVASGTSSSSAVASAWEGQKQKIVSLRTSSTAIFANPLQNIFGNVASSISNIQQQGLTTLSSDESAKMQAKKAANGMHLAVRIGSLQFSEGPDETAPPGRKSPALLG